MSDLVTGDAVVLDVSIAQLPVRAAAFLIDLAVQAATVVSVLLLVATTADVTDSALFTAFTILFIVLVFVGYPVLVETLTRGRSLGKLALGLRVVSQDGGPELFRQALFRALAGFIELYLLAGSAAVICSLLDPRGRRLGDIFSGTMVISERGPRSAAPLPQMPPQLAGWAATVELSQLPDDLIHTARQYLARREGLSPAVQQEMGARIAARTAAFVSPPPPPGVPPHVYVSAVLAERRRRHLERLTRRAAARQAASGQGVPRYVMAYASAPAPSIPAAPSPAGRPASPDGGFTLPS
ncbi:RDD family protein [Planomonospora sp. ID82291]|uniref:RDD family protein n=1 Tax=Planomonospora sp. ID82291 TaxID=2738136 RepID=UPI0018C41B4B|nr:RDD family protein [Planomonospora sp. ID82291]MBG0813331.1 RDD family protein [Planomonospora sp. ID82291]